MTTSVENGTLSARFLNGLGLVSISINFQKSKRQPRTAQTRRGGYLNGFGAEHVQRHPVWVLLKKLQDVAGARTIGPTSAQTERFRHGFVIV